MAISFTRTFANLTSALLSYLDDNFNDINTWIASFFGTATGAQTTAAANKIPVAGSSGVLDGWSQCAFGVDLPSGLYTFTPGTTLYASPSNNSIPSATESAVMFLIPANCSFRKLAARFTANVLSTASTIITIRKNGADTALTVTIPASDNTVKYDLVNTVSFNAGDLLTIKIATAAGGAANAQNLAISFVGVV